MDEMTPKFIYDDLREKWKHEDNLINQCVTWLLSAQVSAQGQHRRRLHAKENGPGLSDHLVRAAELRGAEAGGAPSMNVSELHPKD